MLGADTPILAKIPPSVTCGVVSDQDRLNRLGFAGDSIKLTTALLAFSAQSIRVFVW